MPASRTDYQVGDWVQIANEAHPRYRSYIEVFGVPGWGSNNDDAYYRPHDFFYAVSVNSNAGLATYAVGIPSANDYIVKLHINHPVTWSEAKVIADQQAGGLLTVEEFA